MGSNKSHINSKTVRVDTASSTEEPQTLGSRKIIVRGFPEWLTKDDLANSLRKSSSTGSGGNISGFDGPKEELPFIQSQTAASGGGGGYQPSGSDGNACRFDVPNELRHSIQPQTASGGARGGYQPSGSCSNASSSSSSGAVYDPYRSLVDPNYGYGTVNRTIGNGDGDGISGDTSYVSGPTHAVENTYCNCQIPGDGASGQGGSGGGVYQPSGSGGNHSRFGGGGARYAPYPGHSEPDYGYRTIDIAIGNGGDYGVSGHSGSGGGDYQPSGSSNNPSRFGSGGATYAPYPDHSEPNYGYGTVNKAVGNVGSYGANGYGSVNVDSLISHALDHIETELRALDTGYSSGPGLAGYGLARALEIQDRSYPTPWGGCMPLAVLSFPSVVVDTALSREEQRKVGRQNDVCGRVGQYFQAYGTITGAKIRYRENGKCSRGFGFITFDSKESVDKVVSKELLSAERFDAPKEGSPFIQPQSAAAGGSGSGGYQPSCSGHNASRFGSGGARYARYPSQWGKLQMDPRIDLLKMVVITVLVVVEVSIQGELVLFLYQWSMASRFQSPRGGWYEGSPYTNDSGRFGTIVTDLKGIPEATLLPEQDRKRDEHDYRLF
ncbi:hypothetical protein Acr_13g0009470 [Actinidia rufa]|uniref:RRM domain-containing protein n=1 Tax=Actinidia rufa TaxID=165716 RepID=A0A7J0FNQ3_9ERIC|nr:hypothetical protein Acr_13g0009470 [Actinidia rufa]